ncbi:MAG: hypothetical protein FWH46_04925 [Methanimicrococcus sp.]|nr:hypothetical protein [Methanimicrococcus sp.]
MIVSIIVVTTVIVSIIVVTAIIVSIIAAPAYNLRQKTDSYFSFNFYGCESVRFSRLGATDRTGG